MKEKVKIKSRWQDVTIGEYQQIIALGEQENEGIETTLKMLSILSDKDVDYFESIPISDVEAYAKKISFIHEKMPTESVKTIYNIGGKKFGVVDSPQKINNATIRDLKAIQYIDHVKLIENSKGLDRIKNMHIELSIFLIPKGESYGQGDFSFSRNAEIIKKHMTICEAMAVCAFFLKNYEALIISIEYSLGREIKKAMKKNKSKTEELQEQLQKIKALRSQKALVLYGDGATI